MTVIYTYATGMEPARSVSIIPYDGTLLVPLINSQDIYQQSGNTFSPMALSVTTSGIQGWSCAAVDASGNAYVGPYASGQMLELPAGNPAGAMLFNLPPGKSWTGLAVPSTGAGAGVPYILASDGTMQALVSGAITPVMPGFGTLARCLSTDGTKLYATLPSASEIGTLTLSTATSGAVTTMATPMMVPSCIAASPSGVAVGGWTPSTLAVGASAFEASPWSPGTTAAAVNSVTNSVILITGTDPTWSITQTISGSGAPVALAWTPNGEQLLTADPTYGKVEIFNLTAETLSMWQTLAVTDANAVAVTLDSMWAIIPQPTQNEITVLRNTANTWSISQTITGVAGATSALALSADEFVTGNSGTVEWFRLNASWATEATVSGLGFTPSALATDGQGTVFCVGTSGASGMLAAVTMTGIVATTSWTGSGNSIVWSMGQIMVVDSTSDLVRSFALVQGAFRQMISTTAPPGCAGIGLSQASVWLCGQAVIDQMMFTAPFTLVPRDSGSVSILVSGTFYTAMLGTEHKPSAVTWDSAGNVWCATIDGQLFEVSTAGTILSQTMIAEPGIQPLGIPLGVSGLLWQGSKLYACSSLNGALIELI